MAVVHLQGSEKGEGCRSSVEEVLLLVELGLLEMMKRYYLIEFQVFWVLGKNY